MFLTLNTVIAEVGIGPPVDLQVSVLYLSICFSTNVLLLLLTFEQT